MKHFNSGELWVGSFRVSRMDDVWLVSDASDYMLATFDTQEEAAAAAEQMAQEARIK